MAESEPTPNAGAAVVPSDEWDGRNLAVLMALDEIAPLRYRSRHGDANQNGRAYGGQVLGQALMAASLSVPDDRTATTMQLLFLQGTYPDLPVEFDVTVLQEGKRFSSRHIRGRQEGRGLVLDAHASFASSMSSPRHAVASSAAEPRLDELPTLDELPPAWKQRLRRLGYSLGAKDSMDFRIPDIERQAALDPACPRLRYWLRARQPLPANQRLRAAVFAYLSDWWLNFSSLVAHVGDPRLDHPLYVASLNHSIWIHSSIAPDEWMHCESESPCAEGGRGLSVARIHNLQGQLVATSVQECLMAFASSNASS